MLLPKRFKNGGAILLPCLLGLVTVIFLSVEIANAQKYSESPPRYRYDQLPKTAFTCQGKLPGRYYPDPETDCQMFHVCVRMNSRDVQDFKFLCPNGTVFDSEHQVCIDYYQVVCHVDVGTNPLGHIFEIYKISSGQKSPNLDAGKLSYANPPDSIERNTLGDDFHVEEYNNNRLAASQNALNFRASPAIPTKKSNKAKEDIFYNNKGFIPSYNVPSTTRRTTTTTTTTTTEAPSSSTPRRPSLETFESYETESFSGFIPTRNSFGRGQDPTPDFDASNEEFATKNEDQYRARTETSTTARPFVFQNTFRTTLSHIPSTLKPSAQTFQQQPTRFNDQYFTRVPSTTRRPVSKAAQFFLHTTSPEDYYTPEYRQPTVNPFAHRTNPTTTVRPNLVFQSNSGTLKPNIKTFSHTDFPYETSTPFPTSTTTTSEFPSTTEFSYGKQNDDFEVRQTTTYSNNFAHTTRNSNFFNVNSNANSKSKTDDFRGKSSTPQRQFPPELSTQYVEEETLRPRNINGGANAQNSLSKLSSPVVASRPRDNFGFSTVPPPTTAEPFSTPAASSQQETAQTLAARLQGRNLFQKITTKNPEKYSIFFGRSTKSVSDDRLPSPGPTASYSSSTTSRPSRPIRTRSTTTAPFDHVSSASESAFDRRGRLSRVNTLSSTVAPDQPSSSTRPLRRGVRRRVRPGSRQQGNNFDPQLKYTRRRVEAGREEKETKTDEIFNAEASVFRGDPTINNFFQDQKKVENTGPQRENAKAGQSTGKQRQSVQQFPNEQFYGRRVRPNGNNNRSDVQQNNDSNYNSSIPASHINVDEDPNAAAPGPNRPEVRRRVVKRIKQKSSTTEPDNFPNNSTVDKHFVVTGSTLRPVTRINVKTKLGGKIATTYRTTEITDASSTSTTAKPTTPSTTTTTEEPELITASGDDIEKRRKQSQIPVQNSPLSAQSFKKQPPSTFSNESHLVIKVISDKPFPPAFPQSPSPISIKKPILTSGKKSSKLSTGGTKKSSNTNDEESNTKSPDYDYAYYNTEDVSDYVSETSKIDHKNYGKKP